MFNTLQSGYEVAESLLSNKTADDESVLLSLSVDIAFSAGQEGVLDIIVDLLPRDDEGRSAVYIGDGAMIVETTARLEPEDPAFEAHIYFRRMLMNKCAEVIVPRNVGWIILDRLERAQATREESQE